MNNFHCPDCAYDFYVAQYSFSIIDQNTVYKSKTTGKRIICPKCNNEGIKPIDKEGDFKTLELGKYRMRSIEDRQAHLKERSHKHFEREIKEKQVAINSSPTLNTLG